MAVLNDLKEEREANCPGACGCPCHTGDRVVYPIPCCEPCPYCKKMIGRGLLSRYEPYCTEWGKEPEQ